MTARIGTGNPSRQVIDVQRRLAELGRIRLGEKSAKGAPKRLAEFRLTSYRRDLIESAAALYGGTAREWKDAPNEGGWEVTTSASEIPILIPPGLHPYSQAFELWSGGGCQRRCDGDNAWVRQGNGVRERPCMCDPDNRECQITTRVNVMLPDVPGVGVWRMETHGWNAAHELTTALDLFAPVLEQGVFIRGRMRIENRSKRTPGEGTRRFVVPVIDVDATIGQLLEGGTNAVATIESAVQRRPQLPPPPPPPTGMVDVTVESDTAPMGTPPPLPDATPPDVIDVIDTAPGDAPADLPAAQPMTGPVDTGHVRPPETLPEVAHPVISDAQRKRMWAIAREHGVTQDEVRRIVSDHHPDGNESTAAIRRTAYEAICDAIAGWLPPQPDGSEHDESAPVDDLVAYGVERGLTPESAAAVIAAAGDAKPGIVRAMLAQTARTGA